MSDVMSGSLCGHSGGVPLQLDRPATFAPMPDDVVELLSSLTLFADLGGPQLEGISHVFEETTFAAGQRILRQGMTGSNFYVVVEGEAAVRIGGEERAPIGRGGLFGGGVLP